MMFRRVGTQILLNVTNPELLPLYQGNKAYEEVSEKKDAVKEEEKPKKTTSTKKK